MHVQLTRALNIAKKNKEKVIILDSSDPESAFVVMSLDDYESISTVGNVKKLTEHELLDKINRDIADWKSFQNRNDKESYDDFKAQDFDDFCFEDDYYDEEEDYPDETGLKLAEMAGIKRKWKIPDERKQAAEEIIEDDRQYFEEITF